MAKGKEGREGGDKSHAHGNGEKGQGRATRWGLRDVFYGGMSSFLSLPILTELSQYLTYLQPNCKSNAEEEKEFVGGDSRRGGQGQSRDRESDKLSSSSEGGKGRVQGSKAGRFRHD